MFGGAWYLSGYLWQRSTATWAARVRFPEDAVWFLKILRENVWRCRVSIRVPLAALYCHVGGPGSIPGGCSMVFKNFERKCLEVPGIDPGTSRMLSERSTI